MVSTYAPLGSDLSLYKPTHGDSLVQRWALVASNAYHFPPAPSIAHLVIDERA
jgi:hypothetical protein